MKTYSGTPITKEEILEDVPDTWSDIVSTLIDDLLANGWDGEFHQAKEKFGTLRFYIGQGSDTLYNLIDEAEQKTREICIVCGDKATTTSRGWITYCCDKHSN